MGASVNWQTTGLQNQNWGFNSLRPCPHSPKRTSAGKPANNMKKPKIKIPKAIFGIPIALISLRIYLAVVLGYFFARFLSGRLGSIVFNFGNYTLHFHHWMMGIVGLIFILIYSFSPSIENLVFGFLGGLIFEGVSSYSDWSKVVTKKR